jgi:hypothetical protein
MCVIVYVCQRFFIFDERKQLFTFVIGIEASIVYNAYHGEVGRRPSGDHNGVKARVRVNSCELPGRGDSDRLHMLAATLQIINCFEMSDHDAKLFSTSNDPLRPCYSGCFTPEFYPRCCTVHRVVPSSSASVLVS